VRKVRTAEPRGRQQVDPRINTPPTTEAAVAVGGGAVEGGAILVARPRADRSGESQPAAEKKGNDDR